MQSHVCGSHVNFGMVHLNIMTHVLKVLLISECLIIKDRTTVTLKPIDTLWDYP